MKPAATTAFTYLLCGESSMKFLRVAAARLAPEALARLEGIWLKACSRASREATRVRTQH